MDVISNFAAVYWRSTNGVPGLVVINALARNMTPEMGKGDISYTFVSFTTVMAEVGRGS